MSQSSDLALVCGGGGVWGVAWMVGIAAGFEDAGADLRGASRIIGTSAGSVVGALLAGGIAASEQFERQIDPAKRPRELSAPPGRLAALDELATRDWTSDRDRLKAIADFARRAETVSEAERRAVIADRLAPMGDRWPRRALVVTAIDLDALKLKLLVAESGASLIDAVAASCAVPGVWPPVEIGDRRYVDGGTGGTTENAGLAEDARAVLVLAPMAGPRIGEDGPTAGLAADVAKLESQGSRVVVIGPDEASLATMGDDPLDPARRGPAAWAGLRQGAREADRARELLRRM